MSAARETPGPRLRIERERQGLTLQKAADQMHLDAWAIEALESDQYDRVGPAVFAKGHLKKYASLLGIPADEIVAQYESFNRGVDRAAAAPPSERPAAPDGGGEDVPWLQIAIAVTLALIVAGLLWWKPWRPQGGPVSSTGPDTSRPMTAEAAAESPDDASEAAPAKAVQASLTSAAVPPVGSSTVALPAAPGPAAGGAPKAGSPAGAGRARLRLSFSADSSVDVRDATGKRVFSGIGRANSVQSMAGEAPLRVSLGFASGVQLEINGRAVAIASPFVDGDLARFQAGADGVLRPFAGNARPHN